MEPNTLTLLISSALIAALTGFIVARIIAGKRISSLEAERQQVLAELEACKSDLADAAERVSELSQDKARIETQLTHTEQNFEQAHLRADTEASKNAVLTEQKYEAEKLAETRGQLLAEAKSQYAEQQQTLLKEQTLVAELRAVVEEERARLAELGKQAKDFEVQAQQQREQGQILVKKLEDVEAKLDTQRQRYESLNSEHAELKTSLQEREASHQRELETFSKQKEELKKDFENLANKIFEEKGKTFTHTSQSSIDAMLKPFREQIEGFQKRINEVHDASVKGNTNLNAEIKKVLDIGLKMSTDANNLTSALKGDSQQRGAWGEAQLRRTLEMSGLIEDAHYEVQSSFKDADGKQKQTDYLIKLPDGKHIIIDSKVSLVAYDRSVSAETAEAQNLAMNEHVKAVRAHIDDLASKDYTNLIGMRSPGFVLMFMPIEPAYIDALKANKDLFEYGYKKGIVLVSHTTLIPILRTVSNLWMIERSNQEAREISDKAGDIYNQVCLVAENLYKLGNTLSTVSNHYNKTVTSLVGTRGLHGKVERFQKLSNKVSKSMPPMEPAHIDFESERLNLIVEAIEEEPTEGQKIEQKKELHPDSSVEATQAATEQAGAIGERADHSETESHAQLELEAVASGDVSEESSEPKGSKRD